MIAPVPAVEQRPAPTPYRVETGPGWTLTLSDCMDPIHGLPALTDGAVTHCITDPPYGERTHAKQVHGRRGKGYPDSWVTTVGLGYAHLAPEAIALLAAQFTRISEKWALVMTSHDLCPAWEASLGRYTFAPLPIVMPGMTVRLAGDGPSSWTVWLMVNRPRGLIDGTKPGAYVVQPGAGQDRAANPVKGHKPLELMERIVADYTAQGDLIADPVHGIRNYRGRLRPPRETLSGLGARPSHVRGCGQAPPRGPGAATDPARVRARGKASGDVRVGAPSARGGGLDAAWSGRGGVAVLPCPSMMRAGIVTVSRGRVRSHLTPLVPAAPGTWGVSFEGA